MVSFRCFGGFVAFVSVFRWFRSGVSVVSVVSFRWFRFGVSGFSTCPLMCPNYYGSCSCNNVLKKFNHASQRCFKMVSGICKRLRCDSQLAV